MHLCKRMLRRPFRFLSDQGEYFVADSIERYTLSIAHSVAYDDSAPWRIFTSLGVQYIARL